MCNAIRNLELKAGAARMGGGHGFTTDGLANLGPRGHRPIRTRAGKVEALAGISERNASIRAGTIDGDNYDSWSMTTGSRSTRGFGPRIRKPGFGVAARRAPRFRSNGPANYIDNSMSNPSPTRGPGNNLYGGGPAGRIRMPRTRGGR